MVNVPLMSRWQQIAEKSRTRPIFWRSCGLEMDCKARQICWRVATAIQVRFGWVSAVIMVSQHDEVVRCHVQGGDAGRCSQFMVNHFASPRLVEHTAYEQASKELQLALV